MELNSKASYIKGLFDGYELGDTKESKIISRLLDVVSELCERVSELEKDNDELFEYVTQMASDIIDIENVIYDDEEDYEDYSDLNDEDDEDGDFDDEEYYEIECPSCGDKICFTDDIELDALVCPACGEPVGSISCDGDCNSCDGCDTESEE